MPFLNLNAPDNSNTVLKYIKSKKIELKREIDNSIVIVDFNIPHLVTYRKTSRWL